MKIKDTINFKTLREKGPAALEIKEDEVINLMSTKRETLCIVRQEYLLQLEAMASSQAPPQENFGLMANSIGADITGSVGSHNFQARSPKFFGSPLIKSAMKLEKKTTQEEVEILKQKLDKLEQNHPELFKEKKK